MGLLWNSGSLQGFAKCRVILSDSLSTAKGENKLSHAVAWDLLCCARTMLCSYGVHIVNSMLLCYGIGLRVYINLKANCASSISPSMSNR